MPLRDHFRPPLADRRPWSAVHGQWPATIVTALNQILPDRYLAEPMVHPGAAIEVDVATFADDDPVAARPPDRGPGVALAPWSPPRPTLAEPIDPAEIEEYEVRVYDVARGRRLVAAVELVGPANKDRPDRRRAFVAKCSTLLRDGACVAIVDVVTTRMANLLAELRDALGRHDPTPADASPTYAASCRRLDPADRGPLLETWAHPLEPGQILPTLPLWLAPGLAVPLDIEASYEATCRALRIG